MLELVLALVVTQAPVYAPGTGLCPAGQFVKGVNRNQPPTCAVPAGTGAPANAPYVTTSAVSGLSAEVVIPTCTGTDKLTFNGTSISCAADSDTIYALPAASTTLGGVKMAASCSAGNHVSSIGAGGELTCSADTGGSGAPTTAQYWTGASDAGLSAEHNLGALATGLVLNTAGTPSAYAGASCTAPNVMRVLSASGAVTCYQVPLSGLANPAGDTTFTFPSGGKTLWEFSGATDYAFSIHGTGAFTGNGDLMHLHLQGTPGVTAGADVLHLEWEDVDATGLRLSGPSSTSPAIVATGTVNITGVVTASGFSGPLTGAVTGNASTASALASDPTACGAGGYVTDISAAGVLTCSTPPGTYSLPDAAAGTTGGVRLTGDLGGTATSPSVVDDSHAHTSSTISGLDAANDISSGVLAGARGGGGAALPTCSGTDKLTANGTTWSCATDQTSAGGGYATVQDEGGALTARTTLNFAGAGVTCADDTTRTTCTIAGGGGAPGGSTTQVQYNNASSFDGAANVLITAAEYLQIPEAAEPAAPASGVTLFSERRTPARSELGWVGLSGKDHYAQDAIWQNYVQSFKPAGGTAVACLNCTATAYGSAAAATMTAGAFLTSSPRVRYNSATAINSPAGVRSSAGLTFHRGSAAGTGGFYCVFRVGFPARNGTNVDRVFIGLNTATGAAITTGAPSALLNTVYWGWDATAPATAKLQACGNDGSGAAVCDTSCASDFIPGTTDAYELTIAAKPNDTSVYFRGKNLRTGTTCDVTQSTSGNLPATTSFLTWHAFMLKDGTTTSGTVGIDIMSAYCESDN